MDETMPVRPQTLDFIRELERSSNHKLFFPNDVGHLLETARQHQKMDAFEEAIFLSKFITKSAGVMKRIGPDGDGYDKLSSEVQTGMQKASSLLQSISEGCPDNVGQLQSTMFFAMSHEALERLMRLFADLALVKNWTLDRKPLP
jgi:hypothetical protein